MHSIYMYTCYLRTVYKIVGIYISVFACFHIYPMCPSMYCIIWLPMCVSTSHFGVAQRQLKFTYSIISSRYSFLTASHHVILSCMLFILFILFIPAFVHVIVFLSMPWPYNHPPPIDTTVLLIVACNIDTYNSFLLFFSRSAQISYPHSAAFSRLRWNVDSRKNLLRAIQRAGQLATISVVGKRKQLLCRPETTNDPLLKNLPPSPVFIHFFPFCSPTSCSPLLTWYPPRTIPHRQFCHFARFSMCNLREEETLRSSYIRLNRLQALCSCPRYASSIETKSGGYSYQIQVFNLIRG